MAKNFFFFSPYFIRCNTQVPREVTFIACYLKMLGIKITFSLSLKSVRHVEFLDNNICSLVLHISYREKQKSNCDFEKP